MHLLYDSSFLPIGLYFKIFERKQGCNQKMEKLFCFEDFRINIMKMAILPEEMYRFNTITIKIHRNKQKTEIQILIFIWRHKSLPNSQSNPDQIKQYCRHYNNWFELLQSYSNQKPLQSYKDRHGTISEAEQKTQKQSHTVSYSQLDKGF